MGRHQYRLAICQLEASSGNFASERGQGQSLCCTACSAGKTKGAVFFCLRGSLFRLRRLIPFVFERPKEEGARMTRWRRSQCPRCLFLRLFALAERFHAKPPSYGCAFLLRCRFILFAYLGDGLLRLCTGHRFRGSKRGFALPALDDPFFRSVLASGENLNSPHFSMTN